MAKTIHDLAVAYGKEHQGTVDIEVFEAGSNAVLNIFDDIIIDNYDNTHDMAVLLIKKIKELKG